MLAEDEHWCRLLDYWCAHFACPLRCLTVSRALSLRVCSIARGAYTGCPHGRPVPGDDHDAAADDDGMINVAAEERRASAEQERDQKTWKERGEKREAMKSTTA